MREGTCCRHIGYSFRLAARVLLYASSHRQDNTYHGLCYTSRGALAGTRNSPMGPPWRIDPMTHRTMSEHSYHGATSRSTLVEVFTFSKEFYILNLHFWKYMFHFLIFFNFTFEFHSVSPLFGSCYPWLQEQQVLELSVHISNCIWKAVLCAVMSLTKTFFNFKIQ